MYSLTACNASWPLVVSCTWCPCFSSTARSNSRLVGWSSTIRIRFIRVSLVLLHAAIGFCQRQGKAEAASFSGFALHRDFSPVQLHQMLCNCQAESSPFTDATRCFPYLVKLIENGFMFFGRDADAGIADCDLEEVFIPQ